LTGYYEYLKKEDAESELTASTCLYQNRRKSVMTERSYFNYSNCAKAFPVCEASGF